ncbi:HAD family hydrolase [Pseudomonadales bacterium]|nr:HAD family hydrolase [Pseudomonadales bacterium]
MGIQSPTRKAVFLDRDGVINVDNGYVSSWKSFEFLPRVIEALKLLSDAGYDLVIITNQSGIARGFYSEKDFFKLRSEMERYLVGYGVCFTAILHCPHHPNGKVARYSTNCECRKPKPGMILRAKKLFGYSLEHCILIGDKGTDISAGRAAGVGRLFKISREIVRADLNGVEISDSLWDVARTVIV